MGTHRFGFPTMFPACSFLMGNCINRPPPFGNVHLERRGKGLEGSREDSLFQSFRGGFSEGGEREGKFVSGLPGSMRHLITSGCLIRRSRELFFAWTVFVQVPLSEFPQKERHYMYNGQMELGLGNGRTCRSLVRRKRHASSAQWWFDRMRQVVDHVIEPAAAPRPEQLVFGGAHRQALGGGR